MFAVCWVPPATVVHTIECIQGEKKSVEYFQNLDARIGFIASGNFLCVTSSVWFVFKTPSKVRWKKCKLKRWDIRGEAGPTCELYTGGQLWGNMGALWDIRAAGAVDLLPSALWKDENTHRNILNMCRVGEITHPFTSIYSPMAHYEQTMGVSGSKRPSHRNNYLPLSSQHVGNQRRGLFLIWSYFYFLSGRSPKKRENVKRYSIIALVLFVLGFYYVICHFIDFQGLFYCHILPLYCPCFSYTQQ